LDPSLIYPSFNVRIKHENNRVHLFDEVRKKWFLLSPEEWVRQHLLNYLIVQKGVPSSLISVEKEIDLNNTKKRYDAVVYNKNLKPLILIECKAPSVPITQNTMEQIMRYNLILGVKHLLVTNGIKQFVIGFENGKGKLLDDIPDFESLER
jgi:hypothetical protein